MKFLNKKTLAILFVLISIVSFIVTIYTLDLKILNFKDIFSSHIEETIDNNIKNNIKFRRYIMKIKNKYQAYTLAKEANNTYISKEGFLIKKYNEKLNTSEVAKKLNEFQSKINYVNTNLMLSPSAITIYKEKLPIFAYSDNEEKTIEKIYKDILFNKINITETLKNNKTNYQLFYKTDTNWTVYGAYYAYQEYAKQNNIEKIDITNFDIETVSTTFQGNLYKDIEYTRNLDKMHMFYLKNNSYTVDDRNTLYDINKLNSEYMYEYYLGDTKSNITITNNNINTNKELIIIGDSLSKSIVPFLINHYKVIHLINPKTYKEKISDYIKNNTNINDCIILYNINNLTIDEINHIN